MCFMGVMVARPLIPECRTNNRNSSSGMNVEFGVLQNVFGRPATHSGFTFMGAAVELNGNGLSIELFLRDFARERLPAILARPIKHDYDAAWVRARLPHVFVHPRSVAGREIAAIRRLCCCRRGRL